LIEGLRGGHLRVLIRDNGSGIDDQVLQSGRRDIGAVWMKERTERIGGRLRSLEQLRAGTEVELSVQAKSLLSLGRNSIPRMVLSRLSRGRRERKKPHLMRSRAMHKSSNPCSQRRDDASVATRRSRRGHHPIAGDMAWAPGLHPRKKPFSNSGSTSKT